MYIRKTTVGIFLMMMVLLPTDFFMSTSIMNNAVRIIQFMLFLYFLLKLELNIKLINKSIVVVIVYYVYVYGYSYLIAHYGPNIWDAINGITLSIMFVYYYKYNFKDFLSAGSSFYVFIAIFHFVLLLLVKDSTMYGAYLGKNYVGRFLMPGFMFILLNELYSEGKALTKKSIVQCSLIIMAILLSLSGTAIVGVIVFWLCFFLFSKFGVNKATTVFKFSLYSMVAFILIYFFHIQEYFEFFIVRILHKDLSFTGRTEIWDVSIRTIQNNLLYGVGLRNTYTAFLLNHAHSHQYWLQILLYGGIIAFALVLLLYLFASRNLYSLKCETGSIIISVIIISYLIMGIDEALNNAYFLLPLIVFAGTYKSCSSIDYYG